MSYQEAVGRRVDDPDEHRRIVYRHLDSCFMKMPKGLLKTYPRMRNKYGICNYGYFSLLKMTFTQFHDEIALKYAKIRQLQRKLFT